MTEQPPIHLGKRPRQKDLAEYLGVGHSAVSQYPPIKRELMIMGLWLKRALEHTGQTEKEDKDDKEKN